MTQRLNPNIANALGMDMPDQDPIEDSAPMVTVEPHEIITLDNPNLPDMSDIETKTLEGEKQLEMLIEKGMGMFTELYEELPAIDPKYRSRHLEITALIMGNTLDAIKHKTKFQIDRTKQRMDQASFSDSAKGTTIETANFYGSREEVMRMIKDANDGGTPAATPEDESE